ncbi:maleylpyruvate isomerase family mycothiol-dependent enzyme [Nocardia sp. NPDC059239]|uniref:maleylpyruvate isomerase family mycothiol-dependent enzyme n=1 Tax=unclassified Nocardia TaxID=2637762 RepID=UPI003676D1FF
MRFPGEDALRRERRSFMKTIESLTDEEFDHGHTLCDGWTPRDILAHVIGTNNLPYWFLRPTVLFGVRARRTASTPVYETLRIPLEPAEYPATTRQSHVLQRLLHIGQLVADRGNGLTVRSTRDLPRGVLTLQGWYCADHLTPTARALAILLLGDNAMHHQDVLRGLGRQRDIPNEVASALFREGRIWSWAFGAKQLHYRVFPTTPGGFPCGRGVPVAGTTEALALWLAGRRGIESELTFG